MQMVAISESNIQEKLSSHVLVLSNAYNETTDFDSINTEENLFGAIKPENRMQMSRIEMIPTKICQE